MQKPTTISCYISLLFALVLSVYADRPNILLIVSDDQGYGDFATFGNEIVQTPTLDRLRAGGATLANFYVSPVCAPTRASLLTGRYNHRTGVWDTWKGRENMRGSEVTLAELLREAGYETGHFGKWHLGENAPMRPQDQGFEQSFRWIDVRSRFDPGVESNGEAIRMEGFLDDLIFEKAIDFISEDREEPFFCYVASFLPHDFPNGQQIPDEDVEPYLGATHLTRGDMESYAMITRMDRNIGRLLEALEQQGLSESTIVVFLSDNGPQQKHGMDKGEVSLRYNYGLRDDKGSVYEGGVRLPCFIRWPNNIEAGLQISARTAAIDLLPTILDFADVQRPIAPKIDGLTLAPILLQQAPDAIDRILFRKFQRAAIPDLWTNSAAIGPRWKMVNGRELYDLVNDPGEKEDLAAKHPTELKSLQAAYRTWFEDVSQNPGFESSRVWIGSDLQPSVRFKYWHATDDGLFLTEVKSEQSYTFELTDIQTDLIKPESKFTIQSNGVILASAAPKAGQTTLRFSGIHLEEGTTDLLVTLENPNKERTLSYGERDPGFRYLYIRTN